MSRNHLIQANIHRAKEGARVLEDLARFILKDETLFQQIRALRHGLQTTSPLFEAHTDLGQNFKEENLRAHLLQVVQANALRIQEALRLLEEFSQELSHKQKMKALRYEAYAIHQAIYKKTSLYLKHHQLKGLYLLIDTDLIHLSLEEISRITNKSSVSLVQLRSKTLSKRDFLKQAIHLKTLLAPEKLLIINDHMDIALDVADGVHLGQQDYPLERVRKWLPEPFLLGATCHLLEEAKFALNAGASYISVGCLFPTQTKKDTLPTSLDELEKIRREIPLPLCGIGGIDHRNLKSVLACSVEMVAVLSAVWQSPDPLSAIEGMQKMFGEPSDPHII